MQRHLAVILSLCLAGAASYWAYLRIAAAVWPAKIAVEIDSPEQQLSCRTPVPVNRGPSVLDGFQGDAHPLLTRHFETEVKAYWIPVAPEALPAVTPPEVRRLYTNVSPAVPTKSYTERDFAPLLPPTEVYRAGQLWALDLARVGEFLKQFHPAVSLRSVSIGRRPGPDGAFAVLRAVSATHLDILFRVHAEFDLLPPAGDVPGLNAWYTPACFLGRLLVNRTTGTVEYFQLGVPTDSKTNIHLTWWNQEGIHAHTTHRVERMELLGGQLPDLAQVAWTEQLEPAVARERLAALFYKFKDIHFLPFEKTLAAARAQHRPILAIVLLGALDDQSC